MKKPIHMRLRPAPVKTDLILNTHRLPPLPLKNLTPSIDNTHEIPKTLSFTPSFTPSRKPTKNSSILSEMGFGSVLISPQEAVRKLSRKPSIGFSDFWSAQEKEKFLKEKGFWDEYKAIKQKEQFNELNLKRGVRHSSLPYLLDLKTERKMIFSDSKKNAESKAVRFRVPKVASSSDTPVKWKSKNKKVKDLKVLVDKCEVLEQDMNRIRSSARELEGFLGQEVKQVKEGMKKKKMRMTRQDISKIRSNMYALI